ncbi:Phospholipid scramblase family member 5 [Camelus dromedarius]|uniref:Phospholipid scramblase n=1 Tax=Camelus dromedarius TaxID=9838 RepID=A0A5N4EKI4_CAMDR|nr:Phospholipid scramblase family member 5 [Camelus dromedarius]
MSEDAGRCWENKATTLSKAPEPRHKTDKQNLDKSFLSFKIDTKTQSKTLHRFLRATATTVACELDLIIIHQQVELLGMILGTETCNKYEIKNSLGQRIYFAVEESICFNRAFCSTLRSCTLKITDNSGREVITVNRPLRCNSCWCPCYLQELEIQAPPGTIVGYVAQKWDPFLPKFTIQNANKEDILKIVGPCATCGCFGDVDFEVKTINEKLTIGKISKYWSGFVNDVFTNADNFGIHVPADLDVTVKASMIGACFLFVSMVLRNVGGLFPSFSVVN